MYERFTDRARKVMLLADVEAKRFNHEYMGTEHILLGLIKEGSGVAAEILKNLNIDLNKVRAEIENFVQPGPDVVTMAKLPLTPRVKKVIDHAVQESWYFNHNYVGTEHLLLGLVREQEAVAGKVLTNLGLRLEAVREEVLAVLGINKNLLEAVPPPVVLPAGQDVSILFKHLPDGVMEALKAINGHLEKLVQEMEEAIAELDFEKASRLRERALSIKRKLRQAVQSLQAIICEDKPGHESLGATSDY
jgi:ATP-dependent Clp protease ATP-binding subunit ClpA